MSIDKYQALVALALGACVGCDVDNTPGASFRSGATSQGRNAGVATEPAPNTATQAAPNTATEAAPNTATDPGPSLGPGPVTGTHDCMTVCNHVTQMGCSDDECSKTCAMFAAIPSCAKEVEGLLACASAAATCDALDGCDSQSDALDACASFEPSTPTTPTTPSSPSISDPLNCNITDVCMGCVTDCDLCLCAGQYAGASSSAIASACSADCSSG